MKITRLTILLIGVGILMQFNNCSPMAKTDGLPSNSILATCDANNVVINGVNVTNPNADINNTNCAVADNNNLYINPQGGDIAVSAGMADFNIGGTCNDGGYVSNQITWTLKYNGTMVRNSGMKYNDQTWNGQCVNAKFLMEVHLGYSTAAAPAGDIVGPADDPHNRTGLLEPTTGTRQAYTMDVTIVGFDSAGTAHVNTIYGLRVVNLNPL
jgi:hypothetical protein